MRLRPEHRPADVAKKIREVAQRADPAGGALNNLNPTDRLNAYVAWVNEVERTLSQYFVNPDLVS